MSIKVRKPTAEDVAKAAAWPIWTKEESVFEWHYDAPETCYLLEGNVTVTMSDGQSVSFRSGDMVSFPAGLDCTWHVRAPVRKHYRLG